MSFITGKISYNRKRIRCLIDNKLSKGITKKGNNYYFNNKKLKTKKINSEDFFKENQNE